MGIFGENGLDNGVAMPGFNEQSTENAKQFNGATSTWFGPDFLSVAQLHVFPIQV